MNKERLVEWVNKKEKKKKKENSTVCLSRVIDWTF